MNNYNRFCTKYCYLRNLNITRIFGRISLPFSDWSFCFDLILIHARKTNILFTHTEAYVKKLSNAYTFAIYYTWVIKPKSLRSNLDETVVLSGKTRTYTQVSHKSMSRHVWSHIVNNTVILALRNGYK